MAGGSVLFENIDVLAGEGLEHLRGQFVGVRGGVVDYLGPTRPEAAYDERYDGRRKLLMPGLYNAHGHSSMTLLRGYAENLPLQRWLQEMVWPFEGNIDDAAAESATSLAIAEMLRFGTVSFTDMYAYDGGRMKAVLDARIKCNYAHGILAFDPTVEYTDMPDYALIERLIDEHHGANGGRVKIELGPHAEYDVSEKALRGSAEHALSRGIGIQIHVSETRSEHEECMERHGGLTPVAYLASLGLLDAPVTAAHCVWCTDEDLAIMREHDASVATCPASNLKLGSGIADTRRMLASGVNLAIGTDGASSNNALNLFRDMYLAAIAHKGDALDPVGVGALDVLRAATAGGAHAQRREGCGVLEVGAAADLVALDTDLPWMQPVSDMANNVVYAAQGTEVVLTMVDGEVLYRDGEYTTIDIERAMAETQAARDAIVAKVAAAS